MPKRRLGYYSFLLWYTGIPSMYTLLRQRPLRWLSHVRRMEDGRIPKDLMYGELSTVKSKKDRPYLRFMDAYNCDMKACGINTNSWEVHAVE